jgi:hypothetical protein
MFNTGQIPSGMQANLTILGAGIYAFHCANHAEMKGTLKLAPLIGPSEATWKERVRLILGASNATGVLFDVKRRIGAGDWKIIATDRVAPRMSILLNTLATYRFRVRTHAATGPASSAWSPIESVKVVP